MSPPSPPPSRAVTQPKVSLQAGGPRPAQTPAVQRTVRFEIDAPKAWNVSVAGTFNEWKPVVSSLRKVSDRTWARELTLGPGRYEYRFVVDGEWADDPKAKAFVPNPHGSRNAVLEVR